jgi:hypothetical protein
VIRSTVFRRTGLAVLALAVTAVIAGCTGDVEPAPTATPEPTVSASPSATVAAPALLEDGAASDNLPFFTSIVQSVAGSPDAPLGRAYVDALVAGGFDKTAMQVTEDQSTVGNPAESMQVSVRWGEECLIGQFGPATGAPVTTVMPGLATGACLVGATRPIDW